MLENTINSFSEVIINCINFIKLGLVFNADPWILMEEKSGYSETLELYESADYKKLFYLVEDYCSAAQRGLISIDSEIFENVTVVILDCASRINDRDYVLNKLEESAFLLKSFNYHAG